jgi:HAE1 family hydrophobic/amphiphilic exporter-1
MVVDASIVVLENTLRHRRLGHESVGSASLGAHEVGSAVLASTSTSLSVFIPILFVSGLAGSVLKEISWILFFALSSSAATAVIVVPWLSARILAVDTSLGPLARLGRRFDEKFDRFAQRYSGLLELVLDHKRYVIAVAAVIAAGSLIVMGSLGGELFSPPDMNEFEITVRLPSGYDLGAAEDKMAEIASVVHREVPEIDADLWYAGLADAATIVDRGNPTAGYGRIRLVRTVFRDRSVFEIVEHLNAKLPTEVPDADIIVRNGGLAKQMNYATDGAGFRVEVSGADWNEVVDTASAVQRLFETDPFIGKATL